VCRDHLGGLRVELQRPKRDLPERLEVSEQARFGL
jgi:hypothetical protein